MEETLKKPLFIHSQEWYIPSVCVDCPEFNFVPLPEGAVAYCNRVEENRNCLFSPADGGGELVELDTKALLDMAPLAPVEAE